MAKHNLTWYNNRIAEMEKALEAQAVKIARMCIVFDGMKDESAEKVAFAENFDAAYNREEELKDALKSMCWARDSRNWNGADWSRYDLVTSNVD